MKTFLKELEYLCHQAIRYIRIIFNLKIIGFVLLLSGIAYLLLGMSFKCNYFTISGETIALNFFIIMLGVSFIFPSLLQDRNNGLSTMRIAVFMMINVICMLLLKIGWDAKSLAEIGLDSNWMGVIAFVFGAKATQTYFESKKSDNKDSSATNNTDKTPTDKNEKPVG